MPRGRSSRPRSSGVRATSKFARVIAPLAAILAAAAAFAALDGPEAEARSEPRGRAALIRAFARKWLGTPYLWGGDSNSGIDCSAYIRRMFRGLFQVELPRTTKQQIGLGVDLPVNPMNPSEGLEPGDLFFYVDRSGIPNHVVVYAGSNKITHSESGRGVVIDPIRKLWGRRVVARRFLVPTGDTEGGFGPVPTAGPLVPREIPCPPSVRPDRREVRLYMERPVPAMKDLGERELCDYRVLAKALRTKRSSMAKANAAKLDSYADWMESIETLKSEIGRDWTTE